MSKHEPVYVGVRYFGAVDPTSALAARVGEKYFNSASGEMFTCFEIDGLLYKWKGSQGTLIDTAPITDQSHPDLVAMFTMDSADIVGAQLNDVSPNFNHGTITGAATAAGKIGEALDFSGSPDEVDHGTKIFTESTRSCSFWVKMNSITGAQMFMSRYEESPGFRGVVMWALDGKLNIYIRQSGSLYYYCRTAAAQLTAGVWHHLVMEFSVPNIAKLFVDSVEVAIPPVAVLGTVAAVAYSPTRAFTIGSGHTSSGKFYCDGLIDQARIFDRQLTQAEVDQLYNSGIGA